MREHDRREQDAENEQHMERCRDVLRAGGEDEVWTG